MRKLAFSLVLVACFGGSSARANQFISFQDSVPVTTTNWSDTIDLQKFDTNLGTLCKITFRIAGGVSGNISLESLDNAPSTVNATLSALITLERPDSSTLLSVAPSVMTSDNFSAFDGSIDFAGTSGNAYMDLVGVAGDMYMSSVPPGAADLADFAAAGGGALSLNITAMATSFATGAGNLITIFNTSAAAIVQVTYEYKTNVVPEPATFVSAALGLAGIGLVGLRRRSKTA